LSVGKIEFASHASKFSGQFQSSLSLALLLGAGQVFFLSLGLGLNSD
jgi:hypothetical protein